MSKRSSAQLILINEVRAAHAALERSAEASFAEYATSVGFALTLSKNQVRLLLYLDRMGRFDGHPTKHDLGESGPDNFIAAVHALVRRGLLVHYMPKRNPYKTSDRGWYTWKVTKIGRLVAALCRHAGLGS